MIFSMRCVHCGCFCLRYVDIHQYDHRNCDLYSYLTSELPRLEMNDAMALITLQHSDNVT